MEKNQHRQQAMWMYPNLHGFNPSQRWGHSACYSHGSLYIFGGCCGGQHLSDVQMLDMATMSWTTLETTGPNPGPRDSHSAVILGTLMVVFGGSTNNGSKKVNDLHVLDLHTNRWFVPECRGSPPSPRESHTATLIDGSSKMVVFGGSGEGEANYLNDVHVLDLKDMAWIPLGKDDVKGEVPVPRDSHSAVGIDGRRILIFGGDRGDRYHGDVDVLDMDTLTWSKLFVDGCSPGVRAGHAAVSIGTKVLVIGGVGDKHYYNDVWMLDTSSCLWTRLDVGGHQPQGRFSHTAVVTDSNIAIYGGCGEDERPLNELLLLHLSVDQASTGLPFWMRSGVGTMNPKRKRSSMNSNNEAAATDQEEHSLSLSQHSSSPSQSDQEQTPMKKQTGDSCLANLFQQLNPQPPKIRRGTPYSAQMVREQLLQHHHKAVQQQQQRPTEQNLIGAEVRGRVDGLFDSGLLMTANVNGRILRGVLFPAAPMVGIEGSPLPNQNESFNRLPSSALGSRSENQNRNRMMLLSKHSEEAMVASRAASRVVNRRVGYYGAAESRGSSSRSMAESGTMLKRDHLEGVVLTLGGPGTN